MLENKSLPNYFVNPIALRKVNLVYNFGLSECNKVKLLLLSTTRPTCLCNIKCASKSVLVPFTVKHVSIHEADEELKNKSVNACTPKHIFKTMKVLKLNRSIMPFLEKCQNMILQI